MAAGVESDTQYQEGSLELNTGDSLLIYTDGMIDAIGAQGHYGVQRLKDAFKRFSQLDARGIVAALEKELCAFSNDDISFDDITMLVIKRIV
jgi:sigma-B regulation protein RsbU (phosphoserine phosphatase)